MLNGVFYNCGGDGGGPLVVLVGRVKENVLKGYFMIMVVVVMVRRWCDKGGGGSGCHGCGWRGQGKHGNKRHFVQVVLFQEVQM